MKPNILKPVAVAAASFALGGVAVEQHMHHMHHDPAPQLSANTVEPIPVTIIEHDVEHQKPEVHTTVTNTTNETNVSVENNKTTVVLPATTPRTAATTPETTTPDATTPTDGGTPGATTPDDGDYGPDYGPGDDTSDQDPGSDGDPSTTSPTTDGGKPDVTPTTTTPPEIAPAVPETAPKTPAEASADLNMAITHGSAYTVPDGAAILNYNQEPGTWRSVRDPAIIIDTAGLLQVVYESPAGMVEKPIAEAVIISNRTDDTLTATELQGTITENETAEGLFDSGLTVTKADNTTEDFGQLYTGRPSNFGPIFLPRVGADGTLQLDPNKGGK